jgi:hypothetical protein
MATYNVWSNLDPNDCFEVEAQDAESAAYVALSVLGWSVSADPVEDEDE